MVNEQSKALGYIEQQLIGPRDGDKELIDTDKTPLSDVPLSDITETTSDKLDLLADETEKAE